MSLHLSIFSEGEEGLYLKLRQWRDKLFFPVCAFLAQQKITPNMLSYMGVIWLLFFVYFFQYNPWISLVFLILHVFMDNLDGGLARYLKKDSLWGAVLDLLCDHVGFFIVFLTFMAYSFVGSFWGSVYLLNYTIFLFMVMILRSMKVQLFPIIRSKYYVYLFFLIWLLSGGNYLDPVIIFLSVYMIVTNIFLFYKLRCSLP